MEATGRATGRAPVHVTAPAPSIAAGDRRRVGGRFWALLESEEDDDDDGGEVVDRGRSPPHGGVSARALERVARLAYDCLSQNPKVRPAMSRVVLVLEAALAIPAEEVDDGDVRGEGGRGSGDASPTPAR